MSEDALSLIAEAQSRQHRAEMDRDYWKSVAEFKSRRCKLLVDMLRTRPLPALSIDQNGVVDNDQLMKIIDQIAPVWADPHAAFPDDDEFSSLTHRRAKDLLAYRLSQVIKRAVEQYKSQRGSAP
jgi:hypothetical protein